MESFSNPPRARIRRILEECRRIAVVGISDKPERPSLRVAEYLQSQGYEILPVNPRLKEVLGRPAYASLEELHEVVDVLCIFRRSEEVPPIVEQALALGIRVIWMQDGVVNREAAGRALGQGAEVVMNDCMLRQHQSLLGAGD